MPDIEHQEHKEAHKKASTKLKRSLRVYLKELFGLHRGTDWDGTHDMVEKSIEFRGANLWTLIFAIFIASIGLNVNSTAIIIGAMLISPLMGPIIGVGFGLGTNDFPLFRLAIKNLFVATIISILASSLYFFASPFKEATSEILSRTNPTAFDVFVAIFGGFTGIIATSRRERGNAVPGVAIATALMPPLCVTGYGIGTAQWNIAAGAFYLFLINSLFIAMASLTVVRYLEFPKKSFMDVKRGRWVKALLTSLMVAAVIPSSYTLVKILQEGFVYRNVNQFIDEQFRFPETAIIMRETAIEEDEVNINITVYGKYLPVDTIQKIHRALANYELHGAKLKILQQGKDSLDVKQTTQALREEMTHLNHDLKVEILKDLYQKNEATLQDKDTKIQVLEQELMKYKKLMSRDTLTMHQILKEIQIIYPQLKGFSLDRAPKMIYGKVEIPLQLPTLTPPDSNANQLLKPQGKKSKPSYETRIHSDHTPRLNLFIKKGYKLYTKDRKKVLEYFKSRLGLGDVEVRYLY